jgi:hypothetical protein
MLVRVLAADGAALRQAMHLERDASRAQGLSPGGAAQVEGSGESQANTPAENPAGAWHLQERYRIPRSRACRS